MIVSGYIETLDKIKKLQDEFKEKMKVLKDKKAEQEKHLSEFVERTGQKVIKEGGHEIKLERTDKFTISK